MSAIAGISIPADVPGMQTLSSRGDSLVETSPGNFGNVKPEFPTEAGLVEEKVKEHLRCQFTKL